MIDRFVGLMETLDNYPVVAQEPSYSSTGRSTGTVWNKTWAQIELTRRERKHKLLHRSLYCLKYYGPAGTCLIFDAGSITEYAGKMLCNRWDRRARERVTPPLALRVIGTAVLYFEL